MTLRVHPDEIVRNSTSPLLSKHCSWERVRLGEVADVLNGFAFKSSQFSKDGGMPLIRIRDVGSDNTQVHYVGEFDPRYIVESGAIVVGMDGDFRAARWKGEAALLNQRVCRIGVRGRDLYDEDFLLYVLPGYLDAIHDATSSITVKHLSSETIKQIPLPLPPLPEQRRIVVAIKEHFSRLDVAERSLRDARSKAAALRAAILNAATDGFDSAYLGKLVTELRYGTSLKCSYDAAGPPVLRIPNVQSGAIDLSDLKYATDAELDLTSLSVQSGDLLFVRTNGSRDLIGRVASVDGAAGMAFASYLIRGRPDPARLDSRFAVIALSTPKVRAVIESKAATTAGQYNLNLAALRSLEVPIPSIDEQQSIVREVEHRLAVLAAMEAQIGEALRRCSVLRCSVLVLAFRGELVLQSSSDEPASALLERIATGPAAAPMPTGKQREPATA